MAARSLNFRPRGLKKLSLLAQISANSECRRVGKYKNQERLSALSALGGAHTHTKINIYVNEPVPSNVTRYIQIAFILD